MDETVMGSTAGTRTVEALAAVPVGLARPAFDRVVGDLEARSDRASTWRFAGEAGVLVLGVPERDVRCEHPAAEILRRARGYVATPDDRVRTPVVLEVVLVSSLAVALRLRAMGGSLPEGASGLVRHLAREVEGWARAVVEAA